MTSQSGWSAQIEATHGSSAGPDSYATTMTEAETLTSEVSGFRRAALSLPGGPVGFLPVPVKRSRGGADGRPVSAPAAPLALRRLRVRSWASAWPLAGLVTLSRSEEHTSELQSPCKLVCRLL